MTGIMDLLLLQKFFNIYAWLAACSILIFITAIAHFYQKKFCNNTFFYIYVAPIIIFIIAAMQIYPFFTYEAESLEFLGSLISFLSSYFLYRTMVGVK